MTWDGDCEERHRAATATRRILSAVVPLCLVLGCSPGPSEPEAPSASSETDDTVAEQPGDAADYPPLPLPWTLVEEPDGRTLTVAAEFEFPGCREFFGWDATETDTTVTIEVQASQTLQTECHPNIEARYARIDLSEPLGTRALEGCRTTRTLKDCDELDRLEIRADLNQVKGEFAQVAAVRR